MKINNRRYIGSKTSLLTEIDEIVNKFFKNKKIRFFDPFGGTGVVSNYYSEKGNDVIVNDILYSNYVAYQTWMSNNKYDIKKVKHTIEQLNEIESYTLKDNYFSIKFGNKYFEEKDAKKIGYIRDWLEINKKEYTDREYYILLTSLIYEADKIANTCGHFESFLNKAPVEKGVKLRVPSIETNIGNNEIYCKDANLLVKTIESDVTYIDPPYNARQYVNFYHVLENLARWEKPEELEGKSMKFKRDHLKSEYSKAKAPMVFEDLIVNLKTKLIIVSYNNTYSAKSISSNNKISENQLTSILLNKGKVDKIEIDYNYFNAGKTSFKNHKEYLYVCEVKK